MVLNSTILKQTASDPPCMPQTHFWNENVERALSYYAKAHQSIPFIYGGEKRADLEESFCPFNLNLFCL